MWEYDIFLSDLQKNIASLCIDISVLRNQSKAGTVRKCQIFCGEIDLNAFFKAIRNDYAQYLNSQTSALMDRCKDEDLKFGSARKVLNIFFRHVCYNGFFQAQYLQNEDSFSNHSILSVLEIPVDSRIATSLSSGDKWISIRNLCEQQHQKYQDLANENAKSLGVARIHLDIKYWTPA